MMCSNEKCDVNLETMVYDENSDSNLRQSWPSLNKQDLYVFQLMYKYLKEFSLENLITQSSFDIGIESWITSGTIMKLPQMTIDSLELNNLLKIVNLAKTKPGKRLFKVWMFNPITVQAEIGKCAQT